MELMSCMEGVWRWAGRLDQAEMEQIDGNVSTFVGL